MNAGNKFTMGALFITALLFMFSILCLNNAEAIQQPITQKEIRADNKLLQFRSGNHIIGFAPGKVYLAAMDHALSVEFAWTTGVIPKSDRDVSSHKPMKALSLGRVIYENLWEGISLSYKAAKDGIVESVYHVAPKADVSKIRLKYNVPVEMQKDGTLRFKFERGYMTESAPVAWQDINGNRIPVRIAFRAKDGEMGFDVGEYDTAHPLIIDPTYSWHTFYGGSQDDFGNAIAVDGSGNIYVTGSSYAAWGSPRHAYSGGGDIVVLKLNSSGVYQWHTFYGSGGSGTAAGDPASKKPGLQSYDADEDEGNGVAVDGSGNVYVTGYSLATWKAGSASPLHPHSGGTENPNIFVLKLDSSGAYRWHTFYGSVTGNNVGMGIAVDGNGNVYVTGGSYAGWGSPNNAYSGSSDIVVLKLNTYGTYKWHTFYGSTNEDYGYGIAVDGDGSVYVAGNSNADWGWGSPNNAYSGSSDIVVLKLDTYGTYKWHTFYGSTGYDYSYGVAIDNSGNVYVVGNSNADWGWGSPKNAYTGLSDIVVLKLDNSGGYQGHTFYGSPTYDFGRSIAVDGGDNVYVTGASYATWGSPAHAYSGDSDIFILKLDSNLVYQGHTFYGSPTYDTGEGIAVDSNGSIYVTGYSSATWDSPRHGYSGNDDIFVLKLEQTCLADPAKVKDTGVFYPSITNAYAVATSGQTIQARQKSLTEDLNLTRAISVTLSGGYNCFYLSNPGLTTITGNVTIKNGELTIDKFIIK